MKKLGFLDRYLTIWILLAIIIGILISKLLPAIPSFFNNLNYGTTNLPIAIGLILMLYPPLTKVKVNELGIIFNHKKILWLSILQNWIIGPIFMFLLALVFFHDNNEFYIGLILIGIARCIAMVLVWADLAGADNRVTAGLVAFNSIFQVFFYGLMASFFITTLPAALGFNSLVINISTWQVFESVAIYLGIPFLLAILSRFIIIKVKGEFWFKKHFLTKISPLTLIALLFTIIIMFSYKGDKIIELPYEVLQISIPLTIYFVVIFFSVFFMSKMQKIEYDKAVSLAFTAAGNNFELAIAIAIVLFGIDSKVAFATVIGPLIEVPVLLTLVNIVKKLKY